MRLHIQHETRYRYDQAPHLVVQALHLWPAPTNMQSTHEWQVRIDGRPVAPTCRDGFGNPVATHAIDRPVRAVSISVDGVVDTDAAAAGVQRDGGAGLPPPFYLSATPLTRGTPEIAHLARRCAGRGTDLERLHRLCHGVRDHVEYVPRSTDANTPAAEAFARRAGVCQDHAHILIAAAHALGFAARYVSGYLCLLDSGMPAASHAWAEVHVAGLGWIGLDAANRVSPDAHYVRIGCGRDYRDAAPVRGIQRGGAAEALEVEVRIAQVDAAAPQ